jgi:hypothetical protein
MRVDNTVRSKMITFRIPSELMIAFLKKYGRENRSKVLCGILAVHLGIKLGEVKRGRPNG